MADEEIKGFTKLISETPLELIEMILRRHHESILEEVRDQVKKLSSERNEWREKYHDLVFEVAKKHPGETRHDTAKRYITEQETAGRDSAGHSQSKRSQ